MPLEQVIFEQGVALGVIISERIVMSILYYLLLRTRLELKKEEGEITLLL